jgi:tetrahydrodipicolinate N-succinyltransferase
LIWKLCKALGDSSEDAKFFRDVQVELFAFNGMIIQLQQSVRNDIALPEEQWLVVKKTLEQIHATVEEFGRYVDSFKACPPGKEGTQAIVKWKKKVVWSLSGEKKVKSFRESMQSYSSILTLTLQSFNKFVLYLCR